MAEVVLTLPVQMGDEAQLFGRYLNGFVERRSFEAELDSFSDAPFLMVRSDPGEGQEIKRLIFQEHSTASAFSSGWAEVRTEQVALCA